MVDIINGELPQNERRLTEGTDGQRAVNHRASEGLRPVTDRQESSLFRDVEQTLIHEDQ